MNDSEITNIIEGVMAPKELKVTLWDVGHGLALWVQTPSGHNHLIDTGTNEDFCPARHLKENYKEDALDYLIISHPDMDHVQGLPGVVEHLGEPRVLLRNKSLPDVEKFGGETKQYQKTFKSLDKKFTRSIGWAENPCNPDHNGGVTIKHGYLSYEAGMSKNNSSVVMFYSFGDWLFVFPGDIEDSAWKKLWTEKSSSFKPLVDAAKYRVLVAPHHGRSSGYSEDMMEDIEPSLILISDKYGKEPTEPKLHQRASGLNHGGELKKYFSTKAGGRMQFTLQIDGSCNFHQLTLEQAKATVA